jgi:dephospho-CoA kinase
MKQNKLSHDLCNIIGVTGGVGAGKSTVLDYISRNYNCIVILSDNVANEIKKKGYPAYDRLLEILGTGILGDDGEIDKSRMAGAIFGNKELLDKVNGILHPAVNDHIIKIIDDERQKKDHDFVFVEAALLIENGYKAIVDELWYVYASEDVRRQRLISSRGYSEEKILGIFKNQLREEVFFENADFVIDNGGSLESMAQQIDNKIGEWKKEWQA